MYAAVAESPPTWIPPTVTPSGISFGFECPFGGRAVVVVVVVVVASAVVSGAVVVDSVVVVVSVDGGGDCAPADRDHRGQNAGCGDGQHAQPDQERTLQGLAVYCENRPGSFVITPSTPAATTRSNAATSSTVHASTAAPRACAFATTARETTE